MSAPIQTPASGRYQHVRDLGAGAMGRVSLELETDPKRLVAIKRLHANIAAQAGARLRREFRALSRLSHPNIVRVFDYGEEAGAPFIVMEFIEGRDLNDWILHKQTWQSIARAFAGIADALVAVHSQGLLHRDLKPENIRITEEGSSKLMDFGLTKPLSGTVAITREGAVVGTALYMAPEQCRGLEIDARADLYALGAVMFYALTGRPPFDGSTIAQVLMQHVSQPAPNPRQFNPDIPEAFAELILELLSKLPGDRPASAQAVRDRLYALFQAPNENKKTEEVARADALLIAPLVGRDRELRELMQLLAGGYGFVAVSGDTGSGKTRLLMALEEQARNQGARLARSEALESDPTPFGALSRLIEQLQRHHPKVLITLPFDAKVDLSRIAPQVLGFEFDASSSTPEAARLKLLASFAQLVEAASKVTVLVLENLHWSDTSTLELVAHAVKIVPKARLIVSYRQEDLATGLELPAGLPRPASRVRLDALSEEAMRALVKAKLDAPLDDALEDELVGFAGGNPGALEERLKVMLEAGAILRRAGVYEWNRNVENEAPANLRELLMQRIGQLPQDVLEFARSAAVLGRQFMYEDAKALVGWDDDAAIGGLEQLVRARLITELPGTRGEGFKFAHPMYPAILEEGLIGIKRRRLHARAAERLTGRAAKFELAKHQLEAGRYEEALRLAFEAGREAQLALAYPLAERAYRLALEASQWLESEPLGAWRTYYHLGQVLSSSGRNEEAVELWQKIIALAHTIAGGEELVSRTKVALVKLQRYQGSFERSLSLLGEPEPSEPCYAELCIELGAVQRSLKNWVRAREYGLRGLQAARNLADVRAQALALGGLAKLVQAQGNYPHAERLMQLAVVRAERLGDHHLIASVMNDLAGTVKRRGRLDEALGLYERAAQSSARAGDIALQVAIQNNLASILIQHGDHREASERLEAVHRLSERAGYTTFLHIISYNLAICDYSLGRLLRARERFGEVGHPAYEVSSQLWVTHITLQLADDLILSLPGGNDTESQDLRRLVEAEFKLSNGQYAQVLEQTELPNPEYSWFWALTRFQAAWCLGLDASPALRALMGKHTPAPTLSSDLMNAYNTFAELVLLHDQEEKLPERLALLSAQYRASAIGILARHLLAKNQT